MHLTALSKSVLDQDKIKDPPARLTTLQDGINRIEAELRKSEAWQRHVAEIEERQQTPAEQKEPDLAPSAPDDEENDSEGFLEQQEGHELTCTNPFQAQPTDAATCAFASMLKACKFKPAEREHHRALKFLHEPGPDDDQD